MQCKRRQEILARCDMISAESLLVGVSRQRWITMGTQHVYGWSFPATQTHPDHCEETHFSNLQLSRTCEVRVRA